jgi:hypothetical protein
VLVAHWVHITKSLHMCGSVKSSELHGALRNQGCSGLCMILWNIKFYKSNHYDQQHVGFVSLWLHMECSDVENARGGGLNRALRDWKCEGRRLMDFTEVNRVVT